MMAPDKINQRGKTMSAQTETLQFTISGLPAGTRDALERIGRSIGKTVEEYLRGLIEAEMLSQKPFREILAPIREDFRATGLTEEEFDEIIERERQAIQDEKLERKELAIRVEAPDAISEQGLRVAEAIARQTVVIALQQQGELTIREAAAALGVAYDQYLQLLAERDLGVSRFEQDPAVLQALRRNLPNHFSTQS